MSHNYTQRLVYVNKCNFAAAGIVQRSAARREKSSRVLMPVRRLKIEPVVKRREGWEKTTRRRNSPPALAIGSARDRPKMESTDAQLTSNPPSTMMTCPVM